MDQRQAKTLLEQLLQSVADKNGAAKTDSFAGLRQVEEKVREGRMIISALPGVGAKLSAQMDADLDFQANSRRVRLEALAGYCRSALRFLDAGAMQDEKARLYRAPDVTKLTQFMPELKPIIEDRWLEAQKCVHAKAYLAGVVMMGSILEALLLARATLDQSKAHQAQSAERQDGAQPCATGLVLERADRCSSRNGLDQD